MRVLVMLVLCVACGTTARTPVLAVRFANAVGGGDVGGWFAPDARITVVGDPRERRDPVAALRAIHAGFAKARISIGRIWTDRPGTTAVIEIVFTGRRGARDVGVAGAAVVTFASERVTAVRLYLDLVTVIGQLDPTRLPEKTEIRGIEPPPATGVVVATGAAVEATNLTVTNEIWAGLDAHDADRAMASASPDYRYVDYAAPKVLDREGTRALVAGFVTAVTNFRISAKPVQFAAGDFVITEMVEQAGLAGKPLVLHGLDIKRFVAGHVVEEWQYSNYFEILAAFRGIAVPELP
ncbi:MAG: nuclear transport factor 2 family protein [Kofleriaceae bacterium]